MAERRFLPVLRHLPISDAAVITLLAKIPLMVKRPRTQHQCNVEVLKELRLSPLLDVPNTPEHAAFVLPASPSLQSLSSLPAVQLLFCEPRRFREITLMTITEFFLLHARLHQAIESARSGLQEASPHSHSMPTRLTTVEQLLLWLVYMEEVGVQSLSWVFGLLPVSTLFRYVDHVTQCINAELADEIRWPTEEERERLYGLFSIREKVVAVLDGTHCEIDEPTYDDRLYYSGYKGMTSQNYLAYVNVLGLIIKVEGPFPGRMNDKACYNHSELGQHPDHYLREGEHILADGGFVGGGPLVVPIHQTVIDKEEDKERKEKMLEVNEEIKDNRILVEDVFGWVKARGRRLSYRYGRARERQAEEFPAMCRIHNLIRSARISHAVNSP